MGRIEKMNEKYAGEAEDKPMNENQIIVTVGREHGSGGHFIAQNLADELGIRLYDKEIVEGIVAQGFSKEFVEEMDEKPTNYFLSRRIGEFSNSPEEIVAEKVFEYIREIAKKGESFVIVGRCAESVLRLYPHVISIFVTGDKKDKLERIKEIYHMDSMAAQDRIRRVDSKRKQYHNHYADYKWGDSRGYDLLINSSRLGIDGTAKCLAGYVNAYMQVKGIEKQNLQKEQ